MTAAQLTIRRAQPEDRRAVLELLAASLGWSCDDTFASFFEWKHERNPFGPSPSWVATDGERVVGFRTFLQWRFEHPDGRPRRAVRAVDTATAPEYQGRGVFRQLTMHAVDELKNDGIDFIFNTPNDQSRPGYLKMGWVQVGRVQLEAYICGLRSARRMLEARVPADRWSIPVSAGVPVPELLTDPVVRSVLEQPRRATLHTARTTELFNWRYGYERFHYRALPVGSDPAEGFVIFRVRRRGRATEATICDLVLDDNRRRPRSILRTVARATGADYAIVARHTPIADRLPPLPRQGPILTMRPLADASILRLDELALSLGDVEAL
jgi:GNAT superfamily N-acetyltransferase